MAFSINEIKASLTGGGARNTLFTVQFFNPVAPVANLKVPLLCKSASIPEARIGNMQVPYFGRKINLAGDRVYDPWQVSVFNDEDFMIRNALEAWSYNINTFESNLRLGGNSPLNYKSDANVIQYSKDGTVLREYTFYGIYPADISPIGLDWNATDQIEEFNVTFLYDYWLVSGGKTNNPNP